MGTSQLLYIVLGVIVVGLAIFTGMNMFQSYMTESSREELINHCVTLLSQAEAYHKKPTEAGGGGGSYLGFEIPKSLTKNELGKFTITLAKNKDQVNIVAKGIEKGYNPKKVVQVTARILRNKKNPSGAMQIIVNN